MHAVITAVQSSSSPVNFEGAETTAQGREVVREKQEDKARAICGLCGGCMICRCGELMGFVVRGRNKY